MKKKSGQNIEYSACLIIPILMGFSKLCVQSDRGLLQYVDPYIGSGGRWHVFVGTSVPFGMVQLGPTNIFKGWDWCSGYHYSDSILIGFAHTHLAGTGCADLGDVLLMPVNEVSILRGNQNDISKGYASKYSHKNEVARPEYYSLLIDRYNIKAELTATDRVGFHRYTYPVGKPASVIVDLNEGVGKSADQGYIRKIDDFTIEGYRYSNGWSPQRKIYFILKTDTKIENFSAYDDNRAVNGDQLHAISVKSVLGFGNARKVKIKVELSPVSCANAVSNLQAEISDWNFEQVVQNSFERWNEQLAKIQVTTKDDTAKRIFYTANYHTMIAPALFCDVDGQYRGMNDMIYTDSNKHNYTMLSLWDIYRGLIPLMTITQAELLTDVAHSMLSIYNQQGRLPIWPLMNGETNCMPGYSAVPILADMYLKGFTDFDAESAFAMMKASATNKKQAGIPYLMDKGFIPNDKLKEGVSFAMEYAIGDAGIASMARKMGKTKDYAYFVKRAQYYRDYYDSSTGFVRPKLENGLLKTPFDPTVPGNGDFTEGNGWQYTFLVPQDPIGLIQMFGGDKHFIGKLDGLFADTNYAGNHVVDVTGLIGQYAHGNEPCHHVAYLYDYAGEQWKTAEKVRYILNEFYTDRPDGIIGNEDCGQMSAWYILSSMGFYQVNPSGGVFVFGSPMFDKIQMKTRGGNTFTIETENNGKQNKYIQKVFLNGQPYSKSYIKYENIVKGGTLKFEMGWKANKKFGAAKANRPL